MDGRALFFVGVALFVLLYVSRYWGWFRYLRWKWKAIHVYERQDRQRKGLCVECGYDLTGNTSGVCPECGTSVAINMATKTEASRR